MIFFRPDKIRRSIQQINSKGKITSSSNIIKFSDGYDIQGAWFFRLPNPNWELISEKDIFVTFKSKKKVVVNIPKKFLLPTLGAAKDHRRILTKPNSFILYIRPNDVDEIGEDLLKYIEWGNTYKPSAKSREGKTVKELTKIKVYSKHKAYSRPWYTYGSFMIRKEYPSNLAIIRKLTTKGRENLVVMSEENVNASKDYYFVTLLENGKMNKKIIAAWLSSGIFLASFLLYRREISKDFGEVRVKDLKTYPCINPKKLSKNEKERILEAFNDYLQKQKDCNKPLSQQVLDGDLFNLDITILNILNIQDASTFLKTLYEGMEEEWK